MNFTDRVMAFFRERPNVWLRATLLEEPGGRQAWRTRISDARKRFEAAGEGTIENRTRRIKTDGGEAWTLSEYRFVPSVPVSVEPDGQMTFLSGVQR